MPRRRKPLGLYKITLATVEPGSAGIGLYTRTVYSLPSGELQIYYMGRWVTVEPAGGEGANNYCGSVDLTKEKPNGKKQKTKAPAHDGHRKGASAH